MIVTVIYCTNNSHYENDPLIMNGTEILRMNSLLKDDPLDQELIICTLGQLPISIEHRYECIDAKDQSITPNCGDND
jgi:hypothetical protein